MNRFIGFLCCFILTRTLSAQWVQSSDLSGKIVRSIITGDSAWIAGVSDGLYRSTDEGATWTKTSIGNTVYSVQALARSSDTIVAACYFAGVFISTDNGRSWSAKGLTLKNNMSAVIKGNAIFIGTGGAEVHRSTNGGGSWTPVKSGLSTAAVQALTVHQSTLYLGTAGSGIYSSTNDGAMWTSVNASIFPDNNIHALRSIDSALLVGTAGVYSSPIPGTSWFNRSFSSYAHSFAIWNGYLFVGDDAGKVHRSSLAGGNWTVTKAGLPDQIVWGLQTGSQHLVAATGSGVWRLSLTEAVTNIPQRGSLQPYQFQLLQNYPNPFNPSTTIGFTLQKSGRVSLRIYDALGREVSRLVDEDLDAGIYHQTVFDASHYASGLYYAQLISDDQSQWKKMILMK